jgi:hypothetical protein
MASANYRLNPAAFRHHLLNAEFMVEHMRVLAERGKVYAKSVAPDAPPYGEGYIASFHVDAGRDGGIHHDRAYAVLSNDDDAAVYVEFGTENQHGRHVLLSAMDVMGGGVFEQ